MACVENDNSISTKIGISLVMAKDWMPIELEKSLGTPSVHFSPQRLPQIPQGISKEAEICSVSSSSYVDGEVLEFSCPRAYRALLADDESGEHAINPRRLYMAKQKPKSNLTMPRLAVSYIANLSSKYGSSREMGGIALGSYDENGDPVIMCCLPPGPRADLSASSFEDRLLVWNKNATL